jgi:hypothetical protein
MNYKLKFLVRINALTIISLRFFLLQFALILNEVRWRVASETHKKKKRVEPVACFGLRRAREQHRAISFDLSS